MSDQETNREAAERKIAECHDKLRRGIGHPLVVAEMRDKWLEHLSLHLKAGTADDPRTRL